ncbi:MAG: polyphosphate kinase 2 family protein [Xanthomonadales bacterium]|nr:polyphosphate kinase 2 family protein [Xanthomonadales bacterium]
MDTALTDHPYLAATDGTFALGNCSTEPPAGAGGKKALKKRLKQLTKSLDEQQRRLYSKGERAVLLVFQAMDAAGKDGTIRAVFRRIDPNGCHVWPFKQPTPEELAHDFLWRVALKLPKKGKIGIFNRSHYEEVLVVRVHPEYLAGQKLPSYDSLEELWTQRYESIRNFEEHLARSGTVIIKFWLNLSRDEQARRFIARIDEPEKRWKFSFGDVEERARWTSYMEAYEQMIRATSRPWAPWYAIPADDKRFMRVQVAEIVDRTLARLGLSYPQPDAAREDELLEMARELESQIGQP